MNLCRCERGHFYDKEKYATCPHCAGGSATDETLTTAFTDEVTAPASSGYDAGYARGSFAGTSYAGGSFAGTGYAGGFDIAPGNASDVTEQVTPQGRYNVSDIPANQATVAHGVPGIDPPTEPLQGWCGTADITMETEDIEDNDHTIGIYDQYFDNVGATESNYNFSKKAPVVNKVSTPCVGWLIAMNGEHIGTDFRLKVGKNFIGRNESNDVALTEDKSVSRERQAIVVYEPKTHMYLVQSGDASSLVYRNNELVMTPVKLEAYDMITVGDVNLLFMPLCGERFNWGSLFEEMKKNK
ncbi:MAG: FHA domain-containing protein [Lachnospiraceae bacterium]